MSKTTSKARFRTQDGTEYELEAEFTEAAPKELDQWDTRVEVDGSKVTLKMQGEVPVPVLTISATDIARWNGYEESAHVAQQQGSMMEVAPVDYLKLYDALRTLAAYHHVREEDDGRT